MKAIMAIAIVLAAVWVFMQLVDSYDRTVNPGKPRPRPVASVSTELRGEDLPGLPPHLESTLVEAERQGAEALGRWLKTWGKQVRDPRLAWIELDYAVLMNVRDHRAAREIFQRVQQRVGTNSPVFPRVRKLESAYAQ